jgi:heme oxygenase (biliverdin-IX-beta and delta-forming)
VTPADEARRLLRARRWGVLATLSRKFEGHPYASTVNYVTDQEARPVMLLSGLAEHTSNLLADPRVSLVAADPTADAQATARLTLLGNANPCPECAALRERYLRHFPESEHYFGLGDFALYLIEPMRARFIGGFGQIHWITATQFAPTVRLEESEQVMLARWNTQRCELLRTVAGSSDAEAIGVDCDGLDLRARGDFLRVEFNGVVDCDAGAVAALERRVRMRTGI